jgi:hypothetical protein
LAYRSPVHAVPVGQCADGQSLIVRVLPDDGEQLRLVGLASAPAGLRSGPRGPGWAVVAWEVGEGVFERWQAAAGQRGEPFQGDRSLGAWLVAEVAAQVAGA